MTVPLNYKIMGQGHPVIILHGLFGMMDNWMNMAKRLESAGWMPILIDQRDHGRSPHTDDFSYPLLAADLYQFMEDNWIHDAVLIGHSMGGKTGLQLVSEHESFISKLIVIDMGIKPYQHGHQEVFDAFFAVDLDHISSRSEVEDIMMQQLNDLGTVQFLMKNLTRLQSGGYAWKANISLLYEKYENILKKIDFMYPSDTETLFIKGANSPYILSSDFDNIQQVLPNARLSTIQNAGHWIHVDQPDELFSQIIDFIK
ncbi:MAG: alpha/beta fold hydrolase [Saprospiraceae bacterium]